MKRITFALLNFKKTIMKKRFLLMLVLVTAVFGTANAQHFRNSRYYNDRTDRLDYSNRNAGMGRYGSRYGSYNYYSLRVGATFTTVDSEDAVFDGGKMRTGLNVAGIAGLSLSRYAPLYLETGLAYTEKGGRKGRGADKMSFNLNYLEIPAVLKYYYSPDGHFGIQPYAGGYIACGVGGKIKDYGVREAYNAFGEDKPGYPRFKRFDGGLKVGCGVSYDAFYVDLGYEYGLTNISHDTFDSTHNSAVTLSVGVSL